MTDEQYERFVRRKEGEGEKERESWISILMILDFQKEARRSKERTWNKSHQIFPLFIAWKLYYPKTERSQRFIRSHQDHDHKTGSFMMMIMLNQLFLTLKWLVKRVARPRERDPCEHYLESSSFLSSPQFCSFYLILYCGLWFFEPHLFYWDKLHKITP